MARDRMQVLTGNVLSQSRWSGIVGITTGDRRDEQHHSILGEGDSLDLADMIPIYGVSDRQSGCVRRES